MANIAIFRINYKSDFILTLNSDAGWMTPFCIKFWTSAPSQAYFVGFDGTTYTHCSPVAGEPTKLQVQFDDHHLPIGDLKFQIGYHFTVADFPTSVEDEVINQASVIIEVDDAPAQVMLDLNGETAPEIEFSLPAYANEAQRIANEQARIASEQQRIANEDARIAAEATRQQNEQQRIRQEEARVSEFATLKSQSQEATSAANTAAALANEKAALAADKAALAGAAATLANAKAQLAADKAALADAAATLANDKAALAQQKAEYAQQQGDYAKAQGDTALADHRRAESDHTTAADDHTRAESDHGIAADDHTQAGNDHTRAESDHGIAADDHTRAGNDHTRADSDHGIAADDHTQAGNDHTRAESDHTRAEQDHTDVQNAIESADLVYDISKANAVGGVLATYADLAAALGVDGANVPVNRRQGGMTVKFVLTSDNNYVRYDYMGSSTAVADFTNVANWRGVDEVPIKDSRNLVTSGAVYAATLNQIAIQATVEDAIITVKVDDVIVATGTGSLTTAIEYGKVFTVECSRVYDYITPEPQTFTASPSVQKIFCNYTYIPRDVITLDQTITDPATMITGDLQGDVIKQIRANSHLYLGTPITQEGDTEGTELICQLDDEDSTKYADGTTAVLDGREGDQWLKLPIFWWKVIPIGEAAEDGSYDQYSFAFAFAGEPDPSWNRWVGEKNLLGTKEMKVVDGVGRSVSGGTSTGSFTQAKGNTYAAANNLGGIEVTWEWQWMMCMLFYAWYGNTNSQAVCGIGSNTYARTLGVTDGLGMTDTTPAQATSLTSARFWGLEAWWNCKYEWMGNVTSNNYVLTIKDMNTKQNRTVSGFVQCAGTYGWTSRMKITEQGDFIPVAKDATDATSYCDWVNSNPGSRVVNRSISYANTGGGVAYVSSNGAPSNTDANGGSRLAFNGVVTEAESVAAYKAALPAGQEA